MYRNETEKSNTVYAVIANIAAHDGYVTTLDYDNIWRANDNGWTFQEVTAPYGTILGEYDTRQEANEKLGEYLQCDSVETGRYCYTHNPNPQR